MVMRAEVFAKVHHLRGIHVPTERDMKLEMCLDRLFECGEDGSLLPVPTRYAGGLETRGIMLVEPAGGGKTTAIQRALQDMIALQEHPEFGIPRYLQLQVPSPATLKSVGIAILAATGFAEVKGRATEAEIWETVRHRLAQFGFVVLWIDEAQDLILARSAGETEKTLRMIKTLMQGDHAVVPILSGTQRLSEMASFDPQVSRRFLKIAPGDLEFGADEDTLGQSIDHYCGEVGLAAKIGADLAGRLIHASRRRFGRAIETVIAAIEIALLEDADVLTRDHFAEAWAMQEGCEVYQNVFLADDWTSIQLDREAEEFEEARTKRQRKKLERG